MKYIQYFNIYRMEYKILNPLTGLYVKKTGKKLILNQNYYTFNNWKILY